MSNEVLKKRDCLLKKIPQHIKNFKRKKEGYKTKAFYSRILIASFGLITTVLLGLSLILINPYIKITSIILAISITIISTISVFFDFSRLWVTYTKTLNQLYSIRDDLNYYLAGKPEENIEMIVLDRFKKRLNKILNDTNSSWESLKSY